MIVGGDDVLVLTTTDDLDVNIDTISIEQTLPIVEGNDECAICLYRLHFQEHHQVVSGQEME